MQRLFALPLLIITLTLVLTGCGNKGPLYLPPDVVQETSAASQQAPASEQSTTETKSDSTAVPADDSNNSSDTPEAE